jgi:dTMP kinase
MSGFFLTFEGIEGSGKTTQAQRVAEALRANGARVLLTKEPGGTPIGDRVRAILLDPNAVGMDAMTELFLYAASRRQHVVEVIRPSLEAGMVVISDRYTDATLAYQGFGRTLDLEVLRQLNVLATGGLLPDLTLVFDLPEQAGLGRARARNVERSLENEGRFEAEDLRFHRRVREGYLALAAAEPARFAVIDADGSVDEVLQRVLAALAGRAPELSLGAPAS